jgi:hypothetical protein
MGNTTIETEAEWPAESPVDMLSGVSVEATVEMRTWEMETIVHSKLIGPKGLKPPLLDLLKWFWTRVLDHNLPALAVGLPALR